jgi:hypothetical protein
MRKIILSLCGLASFCVASAQFSIGLNGNYTKYGGDLSKSTPGFGVRVGFEQDKIGGALSFTNGFPITEKGTVTVTNSSGASKSVAAEGKLSFKTFTLMGTRTLIGDQESTGKFYLGFGASYVMAKYTESITESFDNTYTAPEMYNDTEGGLTINGVLGGEYKLGRPSIFAEAGIALPANQVNNSYVENAIPAHFMFNVGIKFSLGGN